MADELAGAPQVELRIEGVLGFVVDDIEVSGGGGWRHGGMASGD
jgi:hypothetical protein